MDTEAPDNVPEPDVRTAWLTPASGAIGVASLLSDLGHEVPTSLLPSFLTVTPGAPAAALGLIEGLLAAWMVVALIVFLVTPSRSRAGA